MNKLSVEKVEEASAFIEPLLHDALLHMKDVPYFNQKEFAIEKLIALQAHFLVIAMLTLQEIDELRGARTSRKKFMQEASIIYKHCCKKEKKCRNN